jgi:hypothetical protein
MEHLGLELADSTQLCLPHHTIVAPPHTALQGLDAIHDSQSRESERQRKIQAETHKGRQRLGEREREEMEQDEKVERGRRK